jgi:hypothetical protein
MALQPTTAVVVASMVVASMVVAMTGGAVAVVTLVAVTVDALQHPSSASSFRATWASNAASPTPSSLRTREINRS